MSGWGSWARSLATSVAKEAKALGQSYLDSVVGEDDEPPKIGASERLLFGIDEGSTDTAAKEGASHPPAPEASSEPRVDSEQPKSQTTIETIKKEKKEQPEVQPQHPEVTPQQQAPSSWLPQELEFAKQQPKNLLAAGWSLMERGAGIALQYVPEVKEENEKEKEKETCGNTKDVRSEEKGAQESIPPLPATTNGTCTNTKDPAAALGVLRQTRERLELQKGDDLSGETCSAAAAAVRAALDAAAVAQFELSSEVADRCLWVLQTQCGTAMRARRDRTLTAAHIAPSGAEDEGDSPIDESLVGSYPELVRCCAADLADVVICELGQLLKTPTETVGSIDWAAHAANRDEHGELDPLQIAKNVADLVFFGLCEVAATSEQLCGAAHSALQRAKKANRDRAKELKGTDMRIREECLVACGAGVPVLEEAMECICIAILGGAFGSLPVQQAMPHDGEGEGSTPDNSAAVKHTEN